MEAELLCGIAGKFPKKRSNTYGCAPLVLTQDSDMMAGAQAPMLDHEVGMASMVEELVEIIWASNDSSSIKLSLVCTPPNIFHERQIHCYFLNCCHEFMCHIQPNPS